MHPFLRAKHASICTGKRGTVFACTTLIQTFMQNMHPYLYAKHASINLYMSSFKTHKQICLLVVGLVLDQMTDISQDKIKDNSMVNLIQNISVQLVTVRHAQFM